MAELDVLIHGVRAGIVTEGRDGNARFSYSGDYLASASPVPLSTSFPLGPRTYEAEAWLDGLLADNDDVRRRWATDYGIYSVKPSDLLGSPVGRDCAGAVQFSRPENTAELMARGSKLDPLGESDVATIVAGLRADAAAWNENRGETAFSLGGAQAKTALRFDGGQWSLPGGASCTTHILKPAPARFPDLDIVEHLCQQAARNLGIQAAATECAYFGDEQTLVVARYDRARRLPDSDWQRIHQEDVCQALGVPPLRKYQSDGGPTPPDIAGLLRRFSSNPDADVRHFLDGLIYNWLIVNTDGHAKNFSLLLTADQVRLAPLYDLCSILPYKDSDGRRHYLPKLKMAMKVGKDYTLKKADRESAWGRAADQLGIPRSETSERIRDLSERIREAFGSSMDTLPSRARRSTYASDLLDEIKGRAVTGIAVSRALSRTSRSTHRESGDRSLGRLHPQPAPERKAICGYRGPRSRKDCYLPKGHSGQHRYSAG